MKWCPKCDQYILFPKPALTVMEDGKPVSYCSNPCLEEVIQEARKKAEQLKEVA